MATYVLVHGAGNGGWCYQHVARILRARGHEVHCPTLTGVGERSHLLRPEIDLDTHVTDVVNLLLYEDLRGVILAGHSYGGMVIVGTADPALDRVAHLVYLDAVRPRSGQSVLDLVPGVTAHARYTVRTVDGVEVIFTSEDRGEYYFGVTDPQQIAWMKDKITPHPWRTFTQALTLANEQAVDAVPRTIVNCTPTLESGIQVDRGRLFDADRVWEIDTCHELMISEPERLAGILGELAPFV